jgi:hypothetical protein
MGEDSNSAVSVLDLMSAMESSSVTQPPASSTADDSTAVPLVHEANEFDCKAFSFFTDGILLLLISAFGCIGNTLTVVTLWSKSKTNSTSLLLLTLAFVDTGVLVTYTVMITSAAFCSYTGDCSRYISFGYPWLIAHFWPIASTLHLASTWLTTLVTFHRYIGVCHPHKFNTWTSISMTRKQLGAIFILAILYNIPRFCDDNVKLSQDGAQFVLYYTKLGSNKTFGYVYNVGLYYVVVYLIPFSALFFMVIKLIKAFEISKEKRRKMTKAKRDENDLTFTLVIVVIVFMFCQIFNPIRRAISLAQPALRSACTPFAKSLAFVATLGIMLNSAVNFIIYCVCGKQFRREMLRMVCATNRVANNSSVVTATDSTNP